MFGKNLIRAPKKGDGSILEIQEIFATFQGEGPFTGYPAIFIRLGGCNLACSFCDTEFDSFDEMLIDDIITTAKNLAGNEAKRIYNLVVITGGEPLRQPIIKLCQKLLEENFQVQIETNGTLFQDLPIEVSIICSPKNNGNGYYPIRPDLLERISAFKFLISAENNNYRIIPEIGQNKFNIPVYVQPIDEYNEEKNQLNRKLTLELAHKYGCRISLQTHKFWDIR
jgi:7-carboxy-7-deazaguanine synthase